MTNQYDTYLQEKKRHLFREQWYWTYKAWCWMRGLKYDSADNQLTGEK